IGRASHIDGDVRHNLGMKRDADLMQAKRLDRPVEHHLVPFDGEAAFGDGGGNVAGRDRAVKLPALASLADDDEAMPVKLGRYGLRLRFQLKVTCLKLRSLALEALAIGLSGAECLALREKIVASESVLNVDDVAHLSEAPDALE